MDVTAHTSVLGDPYARLNRFVRYGEGCVQAHHSGNLTITLTDLLNETFVLGNPSARYVAIRNLIAERCSKTSLTYRIFDKVKRPITV